MRGDENRLEAELRSIDGLTITTRSTGLMSKAWNGSYTPTGGTIAVDVTMREPPSVPKTSVISNDFESGDFIGLTCTAPNGP